MHQFDIVMCSSRQVENFVRLAAAQPFDVMVGNDYQSINGKDIMGMFSLDFRFPVKVSVTCSQSEYEAFHNKAMAL